MSQAITLPKDVLTPNQSEIAERYAKEVALIAIILADNYYVGRGKSYMDCIDELHGLAVKFVTKYAHVEEWEEFCDTQTEFKNIACWDDFVIAWGSVNI
jgi:hypothetical protein